MGGTRFGSRLKVLVFPKRSQEVPRGPRKVPGRSQEFRKGPEGSQDRKSQEVPRGHNGGILLGNHISKNNGRIPRSGYRLKVRFQTQGSSFLLDVARNPTRSQEGPRKVPGGPKRSQRVPGGPRDPRRSQWKHLIKKSYIGEPWAHT